MNSGTHRRRWPSGAQSVDRVLAEILAPRREKWAAYFLGTALGLAQTPNNLLGADYFVILAQALASGRDLADISVMRVIAATTVAVLSNATSIEDSNRRQPANGAVIARPDERAGDSLNSDALPEFDAPQRRPLLGQSLLMWPRWLCGIIERL